MGKPILAVISGEAATIIKNADCGYVNEDNDFNKFSDLVLKMSKLTKKDRLKMAQNSLNYYKNNFASSLRKNEIINYGFFMKKILVTGGAGFIGSNLLQSLSKLNYTLVSLDNYSTGKRDNEFKGVQYIDNDITNIDNIINDYDFCFHLAAQSRVQPSFKNPEESLRVNVLGTSKLLEWSRINNTKIIYAGSSSRHHSPSDSPYAMTKYLGEEICKLYRKSFKVNVQIARFYNVYGPGENIDKIYGNVIGIWRAMILKKEPLPIVGDGKQRDFIHVEDIVEGLKNCFF